MMLRAFFAGLAVSLTLLGGAARAQTCDRSGETWSGQAFANAVSVYSLEWAPFGQAEMEWETYVPLLQHELRTDCGPTTPDFAAALAQWQGRYALTPTGVFDQATFTVLKGGDGPNAYAYRTDDACRWDGLKIEQQAMAVEHRFRRSRGQTTPGDDAFYQRVCPFPAQKRSVSETRA